MQTALCVYVLVSLASGSSSKCSYKAFEKAIIGRPSAHARFVMNGHPSDNYTMARETCDRNDTCKAIAASSSMEISLYYNQADDSLLDYVDNVNNSVWMKMCPDSYDFKLRKEPGVSGYYEPMQRGTSMSAMTALKGVVLKQSLPLPSPVGLKPTGEPTTITTTNGGFTICIREFPLDDVTVEGAIKSWCTNSNCNISPRTYYHPVTPEFTIIGFTDDRGQGHVLLLDQSHRPYEHIETAVDDSVAAVAGIYGFHDKSFALALFVESENILGKKMFLRFYRTDLSVEWTTYLNSAISSPDRNVGDFRLSYGRGYFLVYFSVFGTDNFANGTNGEQISFVDERGVLKTTSFPIPDQKFVKTGDAWGCSHSLGQLTNYHSAEDQFITVCTADLFPKGISLGDSVSGTLIYRADGNGRGFTSAQLGQLAESEFGFKLIFNAENVDISPDCCPSEGVGFISIYNDEDVITGQQAFDAPVWLTSTNGSTERDPVMARTSLGTQVNDDRETYLVGWYDRGSDEYKLGIVNMFGSFIKSPVSVSDFSLGYDSSMKCSDHCVMWGNRDDSLKTMPNGHVGWVYAPPSSKSIWLYDVRSGDVEVAGWSLWSNWARCSRSCGAGTTTRVRSCLSDNCESESEIESTECNTHDCTIPITCTFGLRDSFTLDGDLFVNGVRQFAFTLVSAQEQCALFKDLCRGITRTMSGNFFFYFLKTSTTLIPDNRSKTWFMACEETPGWSDWSTWSACTVPCGAGMQIRSRFCDGDVPGSDVCVGETEETQFCNTGRCPSWSEWSLWTYCSRSCDEGFQNRSRVCTGDYSDQCDVLIGPYEENRTCSLGACPSWTPWVSWTPCTTSCGPGMQERTRECLGDFPCPVENEIEGTEGRSCNLGVCPFWTDWSQWTECRASCGNSTRSRARRCLGDYSEDPGCPLLGEPTEVEVCNLGECPHWSEWASWGNCSASCGNGLRVRSRDCLGDFPIRFCIPGGLTEDEQCNLGECARLDEWQSWGACSVSCGVGVHTRFRDCLGDFPCPEDQPISVNEPCNLGECPSWSTWGSWGPCTLTCGSGGIRTRRRQCLGDFPDLCEEAGLTDNGSCEPLSDCPRWSAWSQWGSCTETCDLGASMRARMCGAETLETCNIGADDPNALVEEGRIVSYDQNNLGVFEQAELRDCSLGDCSYWLEWNTWEACSASCDEGTRRRTRECFGNFPHMCFALGSSSETERCLIGRCGAWGNWMAWGQCSQTCGTGTWTRSRDCLGNFQNTCVGPTNQTAPCDVNDCTPECDVRPCSNEGNCRANEHLTRQYHCVCPPGWMGKNCDYRGPDLVCGSDNIIVSFDQRVVSDEGLIATDSSLVGLASRDSIACTSLFDHFNVTNYYLVIVPTPLDIACGSTMEISPTEYRIRNQVLWQVEDARIRSTVVLIDFTCIYLRNATASSDTSSQGALSIDSYKREVEVTTASGVFEVDISLFRDSTYQRPILAGTPTSLVSLAEGEIVFVSVDLRSKELLPSDDAVLVMDTCFVTSSQSTREPLIYLLRESCPSSPLVTILSNGDSRSGRFSVRVFGWTGRDTRAENVFIHCTVSVCNRNEDVCVPECDNTSRRRRSVSGAAAVTNSINNQQPQTTVHAMQGSANDEVTRQMGAISRNGHPYTSVIQVVPPDVNGEARVNLTHLNPKFDKNKMVSAGPFEIVLRINSRRKRREIKEVSFTVPLVGATRFLYFTVVTLLVIAVLTFVLLKYSKKHRPSCYFKSTPD